MRFREYVSSTGFRSAALVVAAALGVAWCLSSPTPVRAAGSPVIEPPYLVLDRVSGPLEGGPTQGPPDAFALGDRAIMLVREYVDPALKFHPDAELRFEWLSSDGTGEGTFDLLPDRVHIYSRYPGRPSDELRYFTACSAKLTMALFRSCLFIPKALWRTDGTPAGTVQLTDYGLPDADFKVNGRTVPELGLFFFEGSTAGGIGDELWVSDGTPAGTGRLADADGHGFDEPRHLVSLGPSLYFLYVAEGPDGPRAEMGQSDGTQAGTGPRSGGPGASGSPFRLVPGDDEVFVFRLENGIASLWRDPGGPQGQTLMAGDLGFESNPGLVVLADGGDKIFFAGVRRGDQERVDYRLWVSDGTPSGTLPIPRPADALPLGVHTFRARPVGGRLYFPLDDGVHGLEPWMSDGTEEGTGMVADLCPGPCGWDDLRGTVYFRDLGDRPLINASRKVEGDRELLVYAPETGSLASLTAPCPEDCGVEGEAATAGELAFLRVTTPEAPARLWVTDGTDEGTALVGELEGDFGRHETPFRRHVPGTGVVDTGPFLAAGDRLFFAAQDSTHGWELRAVPLPAEGTEFPLRPAGEGLVSPDLPGFAVWVRISAGSLAPILGKAEPECIPETLCVSGAIPGRSEVFVRIVGPRPNGFLWPTLVKFTTSTVEVWIEQLSTGSVRYYRLEGSAPGTSELPGLFDRTGFPPG